MTKSRFTLVGFLCLSAAALPIGGCGGDAKPVRRSVSRRDNSAAIISSVANSLNHLPDEVVENLLPPVPILDDSKSADGQEVLAKCGKTPQVPDGPNNYLWVPKGNANFRTLRVRPGDIVRYFVAIANEEDAEHGYAETTYLELQVRRLDSNNPQNALIVEGGLSGPMPFPSRVEIWRFSDKRMNEIRVRLTRYVSRRKPAVGWEPSPDETALELLIDRTNQWLRNLTTVDEVWQLEPLLEKLPLSLRQAEVVASRISAEELREGQFESFEGRRLQQAIWLRDIATWAKGDALAEIDVATALFDWTVRNIQLDADDQIRIVYRPWQALMYGHGTAEQRAWIFVELCRQQQLDVVMLAIAPEEGAAAARWWLPALVSDGQLFLFDTRLGLPIPGAQLGDIATLSEVVAQPERLRSLDLDGDLNYPITAEDLARVVVQLVATPLQLSQRAASLQQVFESEDFVTLAVDNRRVSEAVAANGNIHDVQLWPAPFQAIVDQAAAEQQERIRAAQRFVVFAQRPLLWKARALHFQGTKEIPPDQRDDPLAQPRHGHREATRYYLSPGIRPPDAILDQLELAKQVVYRRAKQDASYWLGLLSYEQGKFEIAADWLGDRTLKASPNGPWTAGARYNLARAHEAMGNFAEAIRLLKSDDSPQRHGNLLRARQLKKEMKSDER